MRAHRDLSDWLSWMESCHPAEIELGLDRTEAVLKALNLNLGATVITVAGTNGKGSFVRCLEALLLNQGLEVGAYSSPHLFQYNERVRVNGCDIDDTSLCYAFAEVNHARKETPLTYFEFGTLAALAIFAQRQLDVVILEVGLGGRLDAVNCIDCDLAVITSIGLDHQAWLGNDLETIAREKLGVARTTSPVIIADTQPLEAFDALQQSHTVYRLERDFHFIEDQGRWRWFDGDSMVELDCPNLPNPSVAAALFALKLIADDVDWASVPGLLNGLQLPGRFQRLRQAGCNFVYDVAHNADAAALLAHNVRQLQASRPASGVIKAVFGVLCDKDLDSLLQPFHGLIDEWHPLELPDVSRARRSRDIVEALTGSDFVGVHEGSLAVNLIPRLCASSTAEDTIVVFGSFFTVAAVFPVAAQLDSAAQEE